MSGAVKPVGGVMTFEEWWARYVVPVRVAEQAQPGHVFAPDVGVFERRAIRFRCVLCNRDVMEGANRYFGPAAVEPCDRSMVPHRLTVLLRVIARTPDFKIDNTELDGPRALDVWGLMALGWVTTTTTNALRGPFAITPAGRRVLERT